MSEKHLTESAWKPVVAKHKLKDSGLQKALTFYAKFNPEKNPKETIEALGDVIEQALKLKKASGALKEVTVYLDEIVKEATKTKLAIAAQPKAPAAEDDDNADIKVRLINALTKVKADQSGQGIPFVVCPAKPFYGVLLCKGATEKVGPAHKKTLTDLTKGTKFILGRCVFEKEAHTFIVDPVPTGLAKMLKASLKQFTEKIYKVRVRDSEGKVVADGDTDNAPDEGVGNTDAPSVAPAAPVQSAPAVAATPAAAAEPAPKTSQASATNVKKGGTSPAAPPAAPADAPAAADPTPAKKKVADPKPSGNPELDAFNKDAVSIERLILDLEAHPQFEHIQNEIQRARSELKDARDFATAAKFPEAKQKLEDAEATCVKGKGFADNYAAFLKKFAEGYATITVMWRHSDALDTWLKLRVTELVAARTKASPPTRDYAGATADVAASRKLITDTITKWYVTEPKVEIDKLKIKSSVGYVDVEMKEIDSIYAAIVSDAAAGEWGKVALGGVRIQDYITIGTKLADRRKVFDDQRPLTTKAIDDLRGHASLALKLADLDRRVAEADKLASRETMSIEDGVDELKKIVERCDLLKKTAADADAYTLERAAVHQKFEPLARDANAPKLGDLFYGIQPQLERASKFTDADDWKAGRAVLARVSADVDQATKLAAKAKELEVAGNAKPETAAVKDAINKLRAQAETAGKGDDAKLVKAELKQVADALKKAESLAADKPDKAAEQVKTAAALLMTIESSQQQHSRFVARQKTVEARRAAVSKLPTAKANKAKVQAIEKLLKEASGHDAKRAWDKAMPALDRADDAATEAEKMDGLRTAFEAREMEVKKQLAAFDKKALDRKQRGGIETELKTAAKQAGAFQFEAANKALDLAEARMESVATGKLAKQKPPDLAALAASARKVMGKGGDKVIDALVKDLPNDDALYGALAALAKERFGVEFVSDAGDMTKTGKAIWAMLEKVPADVRNNPSLVKVERSDPNDNGGLYSPSGNRIEMNGRPKQDYQGFGKNIADELPKDVEKDCQPANDKKVDYLDFATLHEVGHAVDDNVNFMESRFGDANFGGWRVYGAKLGPIADAVATKYKYDETPEQKKHVLDLILHNTTTPPTAPAGKEEAWADALDKVESWVAIAMGKQVWWNHSQSKQIAIGDVVYHEAYKNSWVSYSLKARQQAITGYQFRAPGEWFAELYASYRIGKLKKTHPAIKWLSKIKI